MSPVNVVFIVLGIVAIACGVGVFVVWTARARDMQHLRLVGTVLLAFGALALVTGWLMTGPDADRGEAVKTGGLAAGSVVALYALWLNDRRRQVDEERQDLERSRQALESRRAEHDRERAADERFLRAVELLGDDADQVRVGALHALAGLARGRPEYTQDVLDVICSYLRRPFDHPRHAEARGPAPPPDTAEERARRAEADRWLQVRLTAQRLIADLLPAADRADAPTYDLDLHGATLEYFDVSHRVIGQLRARELNLYEANSFHHCVVRKAAWFTGATSWGRLYLHDTVFTDRSWFSRFTARGPGRPRPHGLPRRHQVRVVVVGGPGVVPGRGVRPQRGLHRRLLPRRPGPAGDRRAHRPHHRDDRVAAPPARPPARLAGRHLPRRRDRPGAFLILTARHAYG